jgi:hypothetical protein
MVYKKDIVILYYNNKLINYYYYLIKGTLRQNASPFLFPCAIEYSLICAAIMYEIWNHTGKDCHNSLQLAHAGNHSPAVQYTIQYVKNCTPIVLD